MQIQDLTRDELIAIISKLPRTKDGVVVVDGMRVFAVGFDGKVYEGIHRGSYMARFDSTETAFAWNAVDKSFSTREAALSALTQGEAK